MDALGACWDFKESLPESLPEGLPEEPTERVGQVSLPPQALNNVLRFVLVISCGPFSAFICLFYAS